MLCCFISSTSWRMVVSVMARPRSGSNSCRFTPRNSTRRPFTVRIAVADGHGAEADPQRHGLRRGDERAVVAPGRLGRPGLDRGHGHGLPGRRVDAQLRHGDPGRATDRRPRRRAACRGRCGGRSPRARSSRGRRPRAGPAASPGGRCRTATTCPGPPGSCRTTTGAPGPRAGSPPRRADHAGHVELGRQPAAGDDPELGPVQPDPGTRVHPVEPEDDPCPQASRAAR